MSKTLPFSLIAGVDEVGRGCLVGNVVAAAVILPTHFELDGLTDSKKLSAVQRERLFEAIYAQAIGIGIGECSVKEIEELNILNAALEAMRRAVLQLNPQPEHLLIDGNRCFKNCAYSYETVIKGDLLHPCISAASIIAKVTRDRQMRALHESFPEYGFDQHKGYATVAHYAAIEKHGVLSEHRKSFKLYKSPQIELFSER